MMKNKIPFSACKNEEKTHFIPHMLAYVGIFFIPLRAEIKSV